jgi:hypothetical protein
MGSLRTAKTRSTPRTLQVLPPANGPLGMTRAPHAVVVSAPGANPRDVDDPGARCDTSRNPRPLSPREPVKNGLANAWDAIAVLPPLPRDATPTSECPVAADHARWTEARWDGPTARGQPDRVPLTDEPEGPCDGERSARANPWPPPHRARHPHRVSRPGPARRSRRRRQDPKVRRPSTLAPSTPRRSPRRGATPYASALASGAPEGCARTPRSRSSAASDARPRESMEVRPTVGPARLRDALPHRRRYPLAPRPHDPGSTVSPPNPRDRAGRAGGLLPVLPQEAPTAAQRCTTEPARAMVRVRSTTEAAILPLAPRERARARPDAVPPVLLGTSSRQAHSSDPPNRPRRRCRRLDQLPGSTLRRRFRTTQPVGSGPAASEQAPTRWRSTRAEARAHRRNQATREALVRCPDTLRHGVATVQLHDI